ncbi:MAG: hypothetical protein MZV64_19885 [Ignavibacteriales bacterium]|nr:hypothetical protein [Ignavibacteriales bacterium]
MDASFCADGGLLPDGGASACGQEAAREAVNAWQNQFDDIILDVAKGTGVPANLLKNLFAIESQFCRASGKERCRTGSIDRAGCGYRPDVESAVLQASSVRW